MDVMYDDVASFVFAIADIELQDDNLRGITTAKILKVFGCTKQIQPRANL